MTNSIRKLKSYGTLLAVLLVVSLLFTACSNQEISDNMNNAGNVYSVSSVTTPKGTLVEVLLRNELTPAQLNQLNTDTDADYPNATRVEPSTAKYNCHSYAWYSQSTSNTRWMNNPTAYMTDGSYTLITSSGSSPIPSSVPNGSKVVWQNDSYGYPAHSAVKVNSTTVRSKWGPAGQYTHNPFYGPYTDYDTTLKYYMYSKK